MAEPITRPPGPKGRYFIHSPLLGGAGPLINLPRMARAYGDISFWRFLNISSYFFAHPNQIESVLVTHHRSFIKGIGTRANPEIFGNGLLTSEGEFWLRQRRLSQPAFHRTRIAAYADIMVREAERMLDGWRDGQELDIHREMMQTTLAIATRTLFGVDLGPRMPVVAGALDAFIRQNAGVSVWQLILKLPTLKRWRYLRGVRALDEIVYSIIRERRATGMGDDLLSDLLRAQDIDGSFMTDQQIRDEVMTMLLAGHETTALALSWAWFLLASHPDAQAKLQDEVDRVLTGRLPTAADVGQLTYTNDVVRETMRLYPPAWVITRMAAEQVEIGGYVVPAGSNVIVSPWVTHRDARFFPRPDQFDPERWSAEHEQPTPKFAYFPFGGGPRVCIGNSFALMEAAILLAAVAQRFQISLVPGQTVEPLASITLRPKSGVRVQLRRR
ncbi:MAG TPA: cytochrome P450 [Terriglobales bacterium]